MATQEVSTNCLKEFTASRLVTLDKGDDKFGKICVRPVGIREVFRCIVGKLVVKDDIQEALGPLQTYGGLKSEASIHSMRDMWDEPYTEAALLVDADNTFNKLNRRLAIHNIQSLCPNFYTHIKNTYQEAATLLINVNKTTCKQSWYADDSTAVGKLTEIRRWWDEHTVMGPKYGYHLKPAKTVLIIKDPTLALEAKQIFDGTGINLSFEGECHLGVVLGSNAFCEAYVKDKVCKWMSDVEQLSEIGKEEPQAALSAYTKGLCHRL
jgi:hypothetical protein